MAGRDNYNKGEGPAPTSGVYKPNIPDELLRLEGEVRPNEYSEDIAGKILKYIRMGLSLSTVELLTEMPSRRTISRWGVDNPEFATKVIEARQAGHHWLAEDTLCIADDPNIDPAHKRPMIEQRNWLLGRWQHQLYGDKHKMEHTGKDGEELKPLTVVIRSVLDRDKGEAS